MSRDSVSKIYQELLNEHIEKLVLVSKEKAATKIAATYNIFMERANGNTASVIISTYEEEVRRHLSESKKDLLELSEKLHHFFDQEKILHGEVQKYYRKWGVDVRHGIPLQDHQS